MTTQTTRTITGTITAVAVHKTGISLKMGMFDQLNITISDGNQVITVQKLVKPGNDGQGFMGKKVQVNYQTQNGFNKTDSRGFMILEEGNQTSATNLSVKLPITGLSVPSFPVAPTTSKGSYNSDGARHGMIVNNAITLAGLRKTQGSLEGLKKAAQDVKELTVFVETGCLDTTAVEATKTTAVSETLVSPFSNY